MMECLKKEGTKPMKCHECKGRGQVEGPTFKVEWHGKTADLPSMIDCPECSGSGVAKEKEEGGKS